MLEKFVAGSIISRC